MLAEMIFLLSYEGGLASRPILGKVVRLVDLVIVGSAALTPEDRVTSDAVDSAFLK